MRRFVSVFIVTVVLSVGTKLHGQASLPNAPQSIAPPPGEPIKETLDGKPVYNTGGRLVTPKIISTVMPQFSEEARRNKIGGSVEVRVILDEAGIPRKVRVVRGLGYGLDEKAVESVKQYRFTPARKDGVPVACLLYIDVGLDPW